MVRNAKHSQVIRREIADLETIIREELPRRKPHLAMAEKYEVRFMSDALMYLHGSNTVAHTRFGFGRFGQGFWPDWREMSQLRIICEVTSDYSRYVDRERLAGLVVAIDLMNTERELLLAVEKIIAPVRPHRPARFVILN